MARKEFGIKGLVLIFLVAPIVNYDYERLVPPPPRDIFPTFCTVANTLSDLDTKFVALGRCRWAAAMRTFNKDDRRISQTSRLGDSAAKKWNAPGAIRTAMKENYMIETPAR